MRTSHFRTLVPGLLLSASVGLAADAPAGPPAESSPVPAAEQPARTESPSQPTPDTEAAAEAAERQKLEDEALRKEGYKVTEVKGEKRYCKKETILGSRLNSRTVCWTADQIKANKEDADILREKQGQRQTFPGT